MPIVIVANKTDKEREMDQIETETTVLMDWENGYVECSAMLDKVQNKYKLNYFLLSIKFRTSTRSSRSCCSR